MSSQSFNVDDIRRIRDESDKTRWNMSASELTRSISEGAKEGFRILEELKRKKAALPTV
jgi:hypothetical protein